MHIYEAFLNAAWLICVQSYPGAVFLMMPMSTIAMSALVTAGLMVYPAVHTIIIMQKLSNRPIIDEKFQISMT